MAVMVTDAGAQYFLDNGYLNGFYIVLFSDSITLADTNTKASHTEITGGGYADIAVYTPTTSIVSGIAQIVYEAADFIFTGPIDDSATIKGFMACDSSNNTLLFHETFATAYTPVNNGDTLTVNLKLKLGNGTAT